MKVAVTGIAVLALASGALGQNASHTFHLTNVSTDAGLRGVGVLLRVLADETVTVDEANDNVTVNGTDEALALSTWLVEQMDTRTPPSSPIERYTVTGSPQDSVRILYMAHVPQQATLNEFVTTLRTVGDIQRIFTYSQSNAIAMRTTDTKAQLAEWLLGQMDVAPGANVSTQRYPFAQNECSDGMVEVAFMPHMVPQSELNALMTALRTDTGISHLFTHSAAPQSIAFLGCPAQLEAADRIFQQASPSFGPPMNTDKHR